VVYECDKCGRALPPGVKACQSCGEKFDHAVQADPEVLSRRFSAIAPPAPPPKMHPIYIPPPAPLIDKRSSIGNVFWGILLACIVVTIVFGFISKINQYQ